MEEKRLELDREDRDTPPGERHRRLYRRQTSRCEGRIWIFLILGFMMVVFGVIIGGMYLNIRALTGSMQYTEVLPTYVTASAVLSSGLFIFLLFWKRLPCLVFVCVLGCVTTALLCAVAAILTGTHVIQPIEAFIHCTYYESLKECHCVSPYRIELLDLQHSQQNPANYVFRNSSSCNSIQTTLLHMLYALTVTYAASFLTAVLSAILALLVLRMERLRRGMFEDDTYEEIFTVSNSSTPLTSDSDNDNNFCLPPFNDGVFPDSARIGSSETRTNASVIRRCRSFTQPRFFDTTTESVEDPHLTTSAVEQGETTVAGDVKNGGKLKENRRRHRRAVTLHNLDTRQLMMILSLHMRYLEENEAAKSQGHIDTQKQEDLEAKQRIKRALTPQPQYRRCFSQDDSANQARQVRSHTPQPYHERRSHSQDETSVPAYVIRSHTPQPYHLRNNPTDTDSNPQNYENTFDPAQFVQELRDKTVVDSRQQREATPPQEKVCEGQIYENVMDTTDVSSQCGSESSDCPVRHVSIKSKQKTKRHNVSPNVPVQSAVCRKPKQKTKKQSGQPHAIVQDVVSCQSPRVQQSPPREIISNNYDEIEDLSPSASERANQIYQNQDECEHLNPVQEPTGSSLSVQQPIESPVSSQPIKEIDPYALYPNSGRVESSLPIKEIDPYAPYPNSVRVESSQPITEIDPYAPYPNSVRVDSSQPITEIDPYAPYPNSGRAESSQPITEIDPYAPYPNSGRGKETAMGTPIQITNSSSRRTVEDGHLSRRLKSAADHLHPIQTDIPGHLLDRCETPSRPKSYMNAVDQSLSTRPVQTQHIDIENGQSLSTRPVQTQHIDIENGQSLPTRHVQTQHIDIENGPETDSYNQSADDTLSQDDVTEGYLRMDMNTRSPASPPDIYAQPKKTHLKNKDKISCVPDPVVVSQSGKLQRKKKTPFSGERSAFHAVSRHHNFEPINDPYSVDQPIRSHVPSQQSAMSRDAHNRRIVDAVSYTYPASESMKSHSSRQSKRLTGTPHQTDYDVVYPVFEKQRLGYAPPPYSPPPSYTDVFTHSRDSSLPSSSSGTSDTYPCMHERRNPCKHAMHEQFYENNPHVHRHVHDVSQAQKTGCPKSQGQKSGAQSSHTQKSVYQNPSGSYNSGDDQFEQSLYIVDVQPGRRRNEPETSESGFQKDSCYQQMTCEQTADDSDAMETVI